MARKPTPAATTDAADAINGELVAADHAKHGQMVGDRDRLLTEIESRFGLDLPYDYHSYVEIVRAAASAVTLQIYVIGRALIQIKEREPHGRFLPTLEQLGIHPRSAQQFMALTVKFDGSDAKRLVGARLSQSKLLELLAEPDDNIDALADGGTLAGFTLDDIDRLSTSELRAALRKARKEADEEIGARDDIITRKDEKLHKLELKLRKAGKTPVREQGEELLGECLKRLVALTSASDDLNTAVEELKALFNDAGEGMPADIAHQIDHIAEVADSHASTLRDSCEA